MARGGVAAALALAVLIAGGVARGDPSPVEKALAQSLFAEGRNLMNGGKLADACAKFAESDRLDPQLGTHLNLGVCHESLGLTATAWVELSEVADRASLARDAERATFARQRVQDLTKKLSRIRLRVATTAPGMVLKIDGRVIGQAAWGEPFPLDPGSHPLEASAPGKNPWTGKVDVKTGPSMEDVTVPELVDVGTAPVPPPATPPPPPPPATFEPATVQPPPPPPGQEQPHGSTGRAVGFTLGGVGIAGIAVGTVFGALTFVENGKANQVCTGPNGTCPSTGLRVGQADSKNAYTYATVSDIGFGVGIAALAAGAILLFTSRSTPSTPSSAAVSVTPAVGSTGGGLELKGTW
jgi:hypothetical protein